MMSKFKIVLVILSFGVAIGLGILLIQLVHFVGGI